MRVPAAPQGTGPAGRRLWRSVFAAFELQETEVVLLRQAAAAVDTCAQLQSIVDDEGPLLGSAASPRAHPALVELRLQRLLLARLLTALRVPVEEAGTAFEEDELGARRRSQRRGLRGFYGPRSTA